MRLILNTIFLILFLTVSPITSLAGTDSNQSESLIIDYHLAVNMALENNDLVKAAEKMVESARAEGKARYAPFLPQLSTSYSYTRLDKAPVMMFDQGDDPMSIEMGTADNYDWSFNLIFPVYAGGAKPAIKKMIVINEDIAENNLDIARRGISYGVSQAYFGVLASGHLVRVREASYEFLTKAHANAIKWQEEGIFPASEILQMDVAKGRAEIELRASRDQEQTARRSLSQLLGIGSETELNITEPGEPLTIEDISKKAVLKLAESTNGELRSLDLQLNMLEQQLKVTKAGKLPSLNLVSQYTNTGDSPLLDSNDFGDPNTLSMTLQLSWSIYDSKKISQEKRQLENSIEALKMQRSDASEKLEITVESALDDYIRMIDNIEVTSRNLDSAEENLRILNARFLEGLERTTNLLEGETLLATAKLEYNQSLYDSYIGLARLAMETGFESTEDFITEISNAGISVEK